MIHLHWSGLLAPVHARGYSRARVKVGVSGLLLVHHHHAVHHVHPCRATERLASSVLFLVLILRVLHHQVPVAVWWTVPI